MSDQALSNVGGRRDFITKAAADVVGGAVGIPPVAAGVCTYLDPLVPKDRPQTTPQPSDAPPPEPHGRWIQVAKLSELKPGGAPQAFQVIADSWDAWNYYPPHPIGSVYLRLTAESPAPLAWTAVCPHLGCFVEYSRSSQSFKCPCHNSEFDTTGEKVKGPPPRAMDSLRTDLRNGDEVWVFFQRFRTGETEKKPE